MAADLCLVPKLLCVASGSSLTFVLRDSASHPFTDAVYITYAKHDMQEAKAVPLFEDIAYGLAVEVHAAEVEDTQPARLIVCLDHSGSMSGAPLREVRLLRLT